MIVSHACVLEEKMIKGLLISSAGALICLSASAHADLYQITFSGELDSVVDTRTAETDAFAGTDWGLDNYTAQVGDVWEYTVAYDTDWVGGMGTDGDGSPFSINNFSTSSQVSLNGMELEMYHNTVVNFYYEDGLGQQLVEIFGNVDGISDAGFTRMVFWRTDGIDELINDGLLFTDPSVFDELDWAFQLGSGQGVFDLNSSGTQGSVDVTITQIPMPSTLLVLGGAGLIAGRRRR